MELVHVAYINLADNGQCKVKVKPPNSKATIAIQEYPNKFLVLATQIVENSTVSPKTDPWEEIPRLVTVKMTVMPGLTFPESLRIRTTRRLRKSRGAL